MLKIIKNELIHSFIYRMYSVAGKNQLDNIITKDGRWTCYPRIHNDNLQHFKSVPEKEIFEALDKIELTPIKPPLMSNVTNKYGYLRFFYGLNTLTFVPSHRSLEIRYCLKCIRNSIAENGFGFIDTSWYRGSRCNEHQKSLQIMKSSTRKEAVASLSGLLRGESIANMAFAVDPGNNCSTSVLNTVTDRKEPHFAECAIRLIPNFIIDNFSRIPSYVTMTFSVPYVREALKINSRKYGTPIGPLHHNLSKDNICNFNHFWERSVIEETIACGILYKEAFFEKIIKNKILACRDCLLECNYRSLIIDSVLDNTEYLSVD